MRMMREGWHGRTSRRGTFRVPGLVAGIGYQLNFKAEGFAPLTLDIGPLEPFESHNDLEVVMRPGRLAGGVVVDDDDIEPGVGCRRQRLM